VMQGCPFRKGSRIGEILRESLHNRRMGFYVATSRNRFITFPGPTPSPRTSNSATVTQPVV